MARACESDWAETDIPDLGGRTVVVTGANSGLGLRSARVLASAGARVLLACRDTARGQEALASIADRGGAAELVILDLASLGSVAAAAREIRNRTADCLDILMNNAGVMMTPKRRTHDGFELQFGTNHLGHAALTWALMPALRGSQRPRVVSLSSVAARFGRIGFADPNYRRRPYSAPTAYGQSKLATLLFALELDRRAAAAGLGLISVAAHPGLTSTELVSNMARSRGSALLAGPGSSFSALFGQPVATGALPQLYAASAPDVAGGEYFGPDGPAELRGHPRRVSLHNARGKEARAGRLWDLTAELTGVSPDPA
jgi:protochlorophyllide reductase